MRYDHVESYIMISDHISNICQPVQRAVCGCWALTTQYLHNVYEGMGSNIQAIYGSGWKAPRKEESREQI